MDDFRLDGLTILRTADITDARCNATGAFQKQLLIDEQLFQRVPFGESVDLVDWHSAIAQWSRQHRLMILEDEQARPRQFLIGVVDKISRKNVWLRYFSPTGDWDDKPTKLAFKNLTACQVESNYLNVYERYFRRHGRLPGFSPSLA